MVNKYLKHVEVFCHHILDKYLFPNYINSKFRLIDSFTFDDPIDQELAEEEGTSPPFKLYLDTTGLLYNPKMACYRQSIDDNTDYLSLLAKELDGDYQAYVQQRASNHQAIEACIKSENTDSESETDYTDSESEADYTTSEANKDSTALDLMFNHTLKRKANNQELQYTSDNKKIKISTTSEEQDDLPFDHLIDVSFDTEYPTDVFDLKAEEGNPLKNPSEENFLDDLFDENFFKKS